MTSRLWMSVSRQLSQPAGLGGRAVAALMNRGNRTMNERAVELLGLDDESSVLDLGFGGGLALEMLLERGIEVTGIDRAADMVAAASGRHRELIASGRLTLLEGEVASLPLPDASVDRVLTVNTVYFWPNLSLALGEIHRVLTAGGRVVIGIRDPSIMKRVSPEIFTIRPPDQILVAVSAAGFEDARLESTSDQKIHFIVARKPGA